MVRHPGGTRTVTGRATGGDQVRGELSTVVWRPAAERSVRILVITAGTSDLPVARECEATLHGARVAARPYWPTAASPGVHRLLASAEELATVDAVVVVAGMEGALASLVGGMTPAPVVAVPTSTGYGSGIRRGDRAPRDARVVRGRDHRGRHRQRVRRGVRASPACAREPAGSERTDHEPSPTDRTLAQSPGSTASPGWPATWRSAAFSTRAPTSKRS